MKNNSRKQSWEPLIRQVVGPNVPWAWYVANMAATMAVNTAFVGLSGMAAKFASGAILNDTAMLYQYVILTILSSVVSVAMGISGSWADFWTERKIQRRLWTKMIRMPMRLYDRQAPSSLISRVTSDTGQITYSLRFVISLVTTVYTLGLVLVQIAEIMSSRSEAAEREKAFIQPDADIVFDDISFRYEEQEVLKHVSFTIPKGRVTAIVGPSGAGKTTLLSLLERLYTPDGGEIRFGSTPVERIHLDQWRGATGYIQQASPLLSGTIRDNIAYGLNRPATEDEVVKAARMANAYDFIMKLPDGFDTQVGAMGGKLSGGQRQRIAIARMIIKNPDYLLLDEATSALDAENETEVQAALTAMMAGRTAVVVAHNLRTVVNADQIIVMNQGRVQAVGTHKSLYGSSELYTKYFDLQFAE